MTSYLVSILKVKYYTWYPEDRHLQMSLISSTGSKIQFIPRNEIIDKNSMLGKSPQVLSREKFCLANLQESQEDAVRALGSFLLLLSPSNLAALTHRQCPERHQWAWRHKVVGCTQYICLHKKLLNTFFLKEIEISTKLEEKISYWLKFINK